jgi:hypothetical protein
LVPWNNTHLTKTELLSQSIHLALLNRYIPSRADIVKEKQPRNNHEQRAEPMAVEHGGRLLLLRDAEHRFILVPTVPEGFTGAPFLSCAFRNHFRISDNCAKKTKNESSGPSKNINRNHLPTLVESTTREKETRQARQKQGRTHHLVLPKIPDLSGPGNCSNRNFHVLGGNFGGAG